MIIPLVCFRFWQLLYHWQMLYIVQGIDRGMSGIYWKRQVFWCIVQYTICNSCSRLRGQPKGQQEKKNNFPLLYSPKYLASSDKISWNLICNELLKERKKKTKTNLKRCRAELFRCTNNNFPFVIFKVYTCIIKWISKQLNLWAKGL